MAKLFGTEYTKKELLTRVGDISQVAGVRLHELSDGVERGVRAATLKTGSGLEFMALIDRGMDVSTATYNGQSLAWRSSTLDTSPAYFEEPELRWLRSFYGGLVVTCGLTYAGAPCTDQGKALGLHGRVSNTPAHTVNTGGEWDGDEYTFWIEGKVREAVVFGENIEMTRRISAKLGESKFLITDKVTNLGHQVTDHMILYHINAGFPVIDDGAKLVAPALGYKTRDADAEIEKEKYASFCAPTAGFRERVYYIDMAADSAGNVCAALVNHNFNGGEGFGFYIKYPKNELPKFSEWKMMGQGTYVVGLEPANCWVEGRAKERERGTLQTLEAGEGREYHVEIGVLSGQAEISEFESSVAGSLADARKL